jgi:hypothetical protein
MAKIFSTPLQIAPLHPSMIQLYRDQAPHRGMVFACWTPEGNRLRESEFIRRIRLLRPIRSRKRSALIREIQADPHLHIRIKRNLVYNLRHY